MNLALTGLWAESILGVAVVVLCGSTPAVPVVAALRGAAVINRPLEREGELAGRAVGITPQGEQHCRNTFKILLGMAGGWHGIFILSSSEVVFVFLLGLTCNSYTFTYLVF